VKGVRLGFDRQIPIAVGFGKPYREGFLFVGPGQIQETGI
jgi:hypothetical protein